MNKDNLQVDYSQYYDDTNKQVVIKFVNTDKCTGDVCAFAMVVSSTTACEEQSCAVKSFSGQAWLDNQKLWDR